MPRIMFRIFYSALYYILVPFLFIRLLIKHQKTHSYKEQRQPLRLLERLAIFKSPDFKTRPIWLHSVSVGEFIAALPLIKRIMLTYPHYPFVISCTTTTGSAQIAKAFASEIQQGKVFHVYLPYDLPGSTQRFLEKIQPHLGLIMETEIWPNLLHNAMQLNIPICLLNARLSARSAKGYQRIQPLIQTALQQFSVITAQDTLDAERLLALGADSASLSIIGSLKFDCELNQDDVDAGQMLRRQLHWQDKTVLIAASTHKGEEETLLSIYQQLKATHKQLCMIVVPRHPERFQSVFQLLQRGGSFTVLKRSQISIEKTAADILLGDSMGEMMHYFACSDVVFMGGTLAPIGGHNILEPATMGLPIVYGPQMFNFNAINKLFLQHQAAWQVADADELYSALHKLLSDKEKLTIMADNAQQLIAKHTGAVDKTIQILKPYLQ